jgi:hypothetical protein
VLSLLFCKAMKFAYYRNAFIAVKLIAVCIKISLNASDNRVIQ